MIAARLSPGAISLTSAEGHAAAAGRRLAALRAAGCGPGDTTRVGRVAAAVRDTAARESIYKGIQP